MPIQIVVLNYNGRHLLEQCLPSVVRAAANSRYECRVVVIDNHSQDDSRKLLSAHFKQVRVFERDNRGLCSYNTVLGELDGQVAVLLNNDVQLDPDAIDPLVEPLLDPTISGRHRLFFTAGQCWQLDDQGYEGFRTAVRWSWGLVQATWDFIGYEEGIDRPGLTASAGAALAVDRELFLKLGGYDPLYLPGRLEDLDLSYRAYQAGYVGWYVPESKATHIGAATFKHEFGQRGCERLALRNTLLFQFKNLLHPEHRLRMWTGIAVRLVREVLRAPWLAPGERFALWRALPQAWLRLREANETSGERHPVPTRYLFSREWWRHVRRESQFFHRFSPDQMGGQLHQATVPGYRRLLGLEEASPPRLHEAADQDVGTHAATV
ncbi:MAG: glycosyltransferase [Pirellulales bacterium]|nr:glycosyltransferase [Pirellulales bacterium]